MTKSHPEAKWCRYADDGICHTQTKEQAETLLVKLKQRFNECKLEIHPDKTKIVYCKDGKRREMYQGETKFVFMGYEFRARAAENRYTKEVFTSFLPAISPKAEKSILQEIRASNIRNRNDLSLKQIAIWLNPKIRGWINYYGKYTPSALDNVLQRINGTLAKWCMMKYVKLRHKRSETARFIKDLAKSNAYLFAHWKIGITDVVI